MEPFFIFCAGLVGYCGYLALVDLLNDLMPATVPAPAVGRKAERARKAGPVRRRSASGRGRAGAAGARFPVLLRGSA